MDSSDSALGHPGLTVKSPALPTLVLTQLSTGCPQSSFLVYLYLSKTPPTSWALVLMGDPHNSWWNNTVGFGGI